MCADVISWDKAIGKEVKSSDKKDVGKIQSVTTEYITTKDGLVSKKYYFIPKQYVQRFDGDKICFASTKDELKGRFEREDASQYKQKNFKVNRRQQQIQLQQRLQKGHRYGGDAMGEGYWKK